MKFSQLIFPVLLVVAQGFIGVAHADWAQSTSPLVIKAMPTEWQTQPQNPPTFSWARHSSNPASYKVEVRQGTTVIATYTTSRNWYMPSTTLPKGQYTWRVTPSNRTDWSTDRAFVIATNSMTFTIPESATLRSRIVAKSRPRGVQKDLPKFANWSAEMKAERSASVIRLQKEVDWNIAGLPIISDSRWTLNTSSVVTAAQAAQIADVRKQLNDRARQLESASLLYFLTGTSKYLTEALRRGDELAAMNPLGPTNYAQQDQAPFAIASALIRALDTLGTGLDATRKAAWLASVKAYGNQIYADLAKDSARTDEYPFDSHGISNTAGLAQISVLALGDVPDAETWFDFTVRAYISSLSPWSGPEGGFANGTAYAEYAVGLYQTVWQPLLQSADVNLYDKPWAYGFLRFFMYFVPPGQQSHVFGDGHEVVPTQSAMKGYASNWATASAAWYANTLQGDHDALLLLRAPYPLPSSTVSPGAPGTGSAVFPSIGWAAMHSSLRDMGRTSIYFKSSPYGSYNHSHGDQNTFVLFKAGVPMLSEGGYYDYYGSPLWKGYYRSTAAHNGITFDGGVGQLTDVDNAAQLTNNGKITGFTESADVDFVEGDSTKAYGGALTSAVRKLWYLRATDAVVIVDKLSSATARTFEWNMHAFAPMVSQADGSLSITNQGQTVCVRPVSTAHHVERRTAVPQMAGRTETHAVLVANTKATAAEFIVVVDVGCKKPDIVLTSSASGRSLKVGTQVIQLPR